MVPAMQPFKLAGHLSRKGGRANVYWLGANRRSTSYAKAMDRCLPEELSRTEPNEDATSRGSPDVYGALGALQPELITTAVRPALTPGEMFACRGLFPLFRTTGHVRALGDSMCSATVAPDRHRASADSGAGLHTVFQAAADRADLVQQNVAKLDLRHQRGLRRIAGGQRAETRFCGADSLQGT